MRSLLAIVTLLCPVLGMAQDVFINELHYDNAGGDTDEGVEVAGPAGTNLSGYVLTFYNGANQQVDMTLSLGGTIPDEGGSGFGTLNFAEAGIQNGAPDGVALSADGAVIEFLSWEGAFTAIGGVADGLPSTDIGVAESSSTPVGDSLQKTGMGSVGSDFNWQPSAPASRGTINPGQQFIASNLPVITIVVAEPCVVEGESTTATLTVDPAPAATVTIGLAGEPSGEIIVPATVDIGPSGSAAFAITAAADGVADGDQRVTLAATGDGLVPATAEIYVADGDRPDLRGSSIRVATLNIENGVGAAGGSQFIGVRDTLVRLDADVIAFQEVEDDSAFAELKAVLSAAGYQTSNSYFATTDDRYGSFDGGDFSGSQWIAIASRYPITEVKQIGRDGAANEFTRYPLFVAIDVPCVPEAADPSFVAVHYKAGSRQADEFRRAVEGYRTTEFLAARGLSGSTDNIFLLGDCNADLRFSTGARTYSTDITPGGFEFPDGSDLPNSYTLGDDLPATLTYHRFPRDILAPLGMGDLPARQVDGNEDTRNTVDARPLDYIFAPLVAAANGNRPSEVFNSLLEALSPGLPKFGAALSGSASVAASDHLPVFADIELLPAPKLAASITGSPVYEDAGPGALSGSVTLPSPPGAGETVTVDLTVSPPGSVATFPTTLTFGPGESQMGFQIDALDDGGAGPDVEFVVAASAPGYASAYATAIERNREASGAMIISQYVETNSGTSPKSIEVYNATGGVIEFGETPLEVKRYTNGAVSSTRVAYLFTGALAAGEVLVVGDLTTGNYLESEGLITDPEGDLTSGNNGYSFDKPDGDVGLVLASPNFSGDDALEVTLGFTRSDVFGTVGEDPGTAWTGGVPVVSTRDSMLERRAISSRGAAGWTDPSLRFMTAGPGGDLSGFGVAPVLASPFDLWIAGFGLGDGGGDDSDRDGAASAIEFYQGTDPADPASAAPMIARIVESGGQSYLALEHRRRADRQGIVVEIESSDGLGGWSVSPTVLAGAPVPNGDGSETVILRTTDPLVGAGGQRFVRLRVTVL